MSAEAVSTRRFLVTGATGKVGGGAAEILRKAEVPVRVLVRDPAKAQLLRVRGFEVVEGSYSDASQLEVACDGIDSVLLVPTDADAQAADAVVDAASASGVRRIVRISAVGSDAKAHSILLQNHAQGERYLEESGLAYLHLRCNTYFQNLSWYSDWIERLGTIFACHGERPMSWIDARDVAAASAAALVSQASLPSTVELNGPEPLTGQAMADRLGASLGRPITCTSLDRDEFVETVMAHGWSEGLAVEWAIQFTDDFTEERLADGSDEGFRFLTGRAARSLTEFLSDNPIPATMSPFAL